MKEKVYISLPISGREKEAREKADLVKTALSKRGYEVINPFEICHGKDASYGRMMGNDVTAIIDHADAVYFCVGWQHSKGCRVERTVAEVYKKRVMFESVEEPDTYWR